MTQRRDDLINGRIYHIFNKTIDERLLFLKDITCISFLEACQYYRSDKVSSSLSDFRRWPIGRKEKAQKKYLHNKHFRIDILAYCLMPTNFHLLIRQKKDNGIVKFMSDTINSFTKNHNKKMRRIGPMFLPRFKSRAIYNDQELIHVSRYIHLKPYSGGVVSNIKDLESYPWSSYTMYVIDQRQTLIDTDKILNLFEGRRDLYKEFVLENADNQKDLEERKYIK